MDQYIKKLREYILCYNNESELFKHRLSLKNDPAIRLRRPDNKATWTFPENIRRLSNFVLLLCQRRINGVRS